MKILNRFLKTLSREAWIVLALAVLAFLIRLENKIPGMGSDSWFYLELARNALRGFFGIPDCWETVRHFYQSLYPYLIAFASAGDETPTALYTAGRLTSAFMGALTLLPTFWIGRRYVGKTAGVTAALLVALLPQLVRSGSFVLTESTFVCLHTFAFYFALRSLDSRKPLAWAALAGYFLGLATLTRINAIVALGIFPVFVLLKDFVEFRKVRVCSLKIIGVFLSVWCLAYGPYVAFLSNERGHFQISDKVASSQISIRGTYIGYPPKYKETDLFPSEYEKAGQRKPKSLLDYYLHFPKTALRVTFKNLQNGHFDDTLENYDLPSALLLLIGIGLFSWFALWPDRKKTKAPFQKMTLLFSASALWLGGYYLFNAFFLIMLQRFFEHGYILLCLFAGAGVEFLFSQRFFKKTPIKAATLVLISANFALPFITLITPLKVPEQIPAGTPTFQGRESLFQTGIFWNHSDPLQFGISRCRAGFTPPQTEKQKKAFEKKLSKLEPNYIFCSGQKEAEQLCAYLKKNGD